jgi:hypothetical protein
MRLICAEEAAERFRVRYSGRFAAGLPRTEGGQSPLFLQFEGVGGADPHRGFVVGGLRHAQHLTEAHRRDGPGPTVPKNPALPERSKIQG